MNRQNDIYTGGLDKKLFFWKIDDQFTAHTQIVHELHTSKINCLYYDGYSDSIFSGGQDCRLIKYQVDRQVSLLGHDKFESSIRDIAPIKTNPHLLLAR